MTSAPSTAETAAAESTSAPAISNVPEPVKLESFKPVELPDSVETFNVSDLVLDPDNQVRRFEPTQKDITELAGDIVLNGQIQPILYRKVNGKNIVVDGATRVRAIDHINTNKMTDKRMKVKAICVDLTDMDAFMKGAAANMKRYQMSPIDHGRVVNMYLSNGLSKSETARALHRSPAWVTEICAMVALRSSIQRLIHQGEISYSVARELVQMEEKDQDEYIKENVGDGKKGKGVKGRSAAKAKRRAAAQAKGGGQTDAKMPLTLREVREVFEDFAGVGKEAEKAAKDGKEYECKYSRKVQAIAVAVIKAMDGKLGERALASRLDEAK